MNAIDWKLCFFQNLKKKLQIFDAILKKQTFFLRLGGEAAPARPCYSSTGRGQGGTGLPGTQVVL